MRRKKLWDLLLFLVMNVLINLVDLITDGFTAYYLCMFSFKKNYKFLNFCYRGSPYILVGVNYILDVFSILPQPFDHLSQTKETSEIWIKRIFSPFPSVRTCQEQLFNAQALQGQILRLHASGFNESSGRD